MLAFPSFDLAAITAEIETDAILLYIYKKTISELSVPFGLLQPDNTTTPCSTGSQYDVGVP